MRGRSHYVGLCLAIALVAALGLGCNTGPDEQGTMLDPMVFPWEGHLGYSGWGSTAAIVIDSNYQTWTDAWERYNLNTDRVTIMIADAESGSGYDWSTPVEANLRYVVDLGRPPTSKGSMTEPGAWFTAAVFDLPDVFSFPTPYPAAEDYPFMALVQVYISDAGPAPVYQSRMKINVVAGAPQTLVDETIYGQEGFWESLEPQRMIRLRGKRGDEGSGRFWPGQEPIGGIEFDFQYTTDCVSAVRAYPSSDAATATAIVGPPTAVPPDEETVHVVMVDPKGIDLTFLEEFYSFPQWRDETLAGQGPLIDLAVDAGADPGSCDIALASTFTISNLLVTDVDGATIIDNPSTVAVDTEDSVDPNAVLRLYAMDVP